MSKGLFFSLSWILTRFNQYLVVTRLERDLTNISLWQGLKGIMSQGLLFECNKIFRISPIKIRKLIGSSWIIWRNNSCVVTSMYKGCCAYDNNLMRIPWISQVRRTIPNSTKKTPRESTRANKQFNEVRPQCLRPRGNQKRGFYFGRLITITSSLSQGSRELQQSQHSDSNPRK